jgi:hypothetical protein
MKRYQDINWIVKLWRRRHYMYIPFKYVWYTYISPMKIPETEYDDRDEINTHGDVDEY